MDLIDFILKAKLSGYAANDGRTAREFDDGSKGSEYESGAYRYVDRFYGFNPFSGTEHVFDRGGLLIWKMNYFGEVVANGIDAKRIYGFLKEAMLLITPEYPFRGPANLEKEKFRYENIQKGTFDSFHGIESIYAVKERVYYLYYHGGKMIKKL